MHLSATTLARGSLAVMLLMWAAQNPFTKQFHPRFRAGVLDVPFLCRLSLSQR
jgi:hypothetical protein